MRRLLFLSCAMLATILLSVQATAQPARCGDRTSIISKLSEKYGETPQSIGLGQNNGVVEVFASLETGTWTILMTLPDGRSCLIAAGEAFETISTPAAAIGDGT